MEVTINKLNYWFHDHKAKRESYTALQSVELKFTSENGNCNKCSKFQLLSTHVYLTFHPFSILHCVLLGVNLSEKTAMNSDNFYKTYRNTPIYNKIGVARKVNLTDNVLFYIHYETSYP